MKMLKVLLVCFSIFSLVSCSDKNEDLNKAPGEFTVSFVATKVSTPTFTSTVGVVWTKAVDPDGDTVTYDVYVDDVLKESDLGKREASVEFSGLKSMTVKVVAKDTNGATAIAEATKVVKVK